MNVGAALPILTYTLLLASNAQNGIEALSEFSTFSVIIALFALTIIVAIGFGVFLFGFVRLIARRSI